MANDKKSKVTEIEDWDDDLDSLFEGDSFDFGLDERKVKNDDRKPVDRVIKGSISGMKSHLASREAQLKFVKSALPKEYSYPIESVASASDSIARLYDDSARELRPKLSAVSRAASKIIPKEYSFTKKLAEKFEKWGGGEPKRYQGMSEEDIQDSHVASMLSSVFGEQSELQEKERAENRIEKRITDKRMKGMQGMLGSLVNYASEQSSYQRNIDIAYKKKSLELQLRSFTTQETLLRETRQHFEATRLQNEAIIKNTGYPDFIKLRKSEDFAQSMRRRLYDNIQTGLFGKGDFLKKGVENLKAATLRKVGDFGSAMDMAKEGLEGVQEYRDSVRQNAELMGDEYDGLKEGSSVAGKTVLGWAGGQIGKKIRSRLDREDGKSKRYGYMASRYIQDLPGLIDRIEESQLVSEADYTGGIKGLAGKAVGSLINTFRPKGLELGVEKEGGIKSLNQPAVIDHRFKKTVESVIPGYLARILRTVQIIQTGNQDIKLTLFDHENGDFTDASSLTNRISSRLKKTATSSGWYNSEMESTLNFLDPEKKLNEDERKALQSVLVKAMFSGRGMGPEALTRRQNLRHLDPTLSDKLKNHIDETILNSGDKEKKSADVSRKLLALKNQVGDIRGEVQSLYDAGYGDVLKEASIIKEENGYLQIDVAKYMTFLGTEIGESIQEDLIIDKADNLKKRKKNRLTAGQEAKILLRRGKKKAKAKTSDLIQSASQKMETSGADDYVRRQMAQVKSLIPEENQKKLLETKNTIITTLTDKEKRDAQKDKATELSKEYLAAFKDKEKRDALIAGIHANLDPKLNILQEGLIGVKETVLDQEKRQKVKKDIEGKVSETKEILENRDLRTKFIQEQKGKIQDGVKDLYIKGQSSPAVKATELRAKRYYDQVSGKVIKTIKDIKGPVVDEEGHIVISMNDLEEGIEDNQGKSVKIKLHPKIANVFKNKHSLLEMGKEKLKSLHPKSNPLDDHQEDNAPLSSPSSSSDAGVGTSGNLTQHLTSGFKKVKDLIQSDTSQDYLNKGKDYLKTQTSGLGDLVKKPGFLQKGKVGTAFKIGSMGANGLWGAVKKGADLVGDIATKKPGEEEPTSLVDRARALGQKAISRKDQALASLRAQLDQNELSSERKGGWKGIMEAYRLRDEEKKRNQQQIQAPSDPRYMGGKGVLDGLVGKLKSTMGNILDGFGSISDLLAGRNKKGGLIGKALKYFAKGYSKMPGDALRIGKGALNVGGKALTAAKHLSGYSTVKGLYNVGSKALPHITNAGRVITSPLARLGAPLAEGVGALKATATGARLVQAANIARVGLLAGGEVFGGSLGGAAMTGLGMSLSAVGAALTSPIVLGAAAVAAIGYGGYKAYKYFTRNKASDIVKIRLRQYGLTNEFESNYHRIFALEDYLLDGRIGFKGFDPQMASGKIEVAELLDIFDIDPKDGKMLQRFMAWWNNRFKLVFFHHLKALKQINDKVSLKDVNDLNEDEKRRYINASSMEYGPFDEVSSPFKEFDTLLANKNDVEREILNAKNKLEGLKKKDNRPAFLLKRDQEKKDNETKSSTKTEPSLYDKTVDWTSRNVIEPSMEGLKTAGKAIKGGYEKVVDLGRESGRKTVDAASQAIEGGRKIYDKAVDKTSQAIETGANVVKDVVRKAKGIGSFASKEKFIQAIFPAALRSSQDLNVPVESIIGQAGLESSWGSKTSGDYNYFGMKAGKNWKGKTTDISTHEVYGGNRVGIVDKFRAFNSVEEGIMGHNQFLKSGRYRGVIGSKSAAEYFSALKNAGYATDPKYINIGVSAANSAKKTIKSLGLDKEASGEKTPPEKLTATIPEKKTDLLTPPNSKQDLSINTSPVIEKTDIPNASIKKSDLPPPNPNLPGEESGKDQTPKKLTKSDAFKISGANMAGVNPEFLSRFDAAAQEFLEMGGKKPTVTSGFRDPEKQKQLYAQAKDKAYVAKPGNSMHEYGYALDVDYKNGDTLNQMDKMGLLQKHGLWRPLLSKSPFEPWHLEPAPPFNRDVIRHTKGAVGGLGSDDSSTTYRQDQETQKPSLDGLGVEPLQPSLKSGVDVEGTGVTPPTPSPAIQTPKPIEIPGLQKPPIDQYVPPSNDFSNLEGGIGKTNEILQKSHEVLAQLLTEIQQHTPLLRELSAKFTKNESQGSNPQSEESSPLDWQQGIKEAQLKPSGKSTPLKPSVGFSRRAI